MDKLILFLLLVLILVNVFLALKLNDKTEGFKDLNLTDIDKSVPLWRVIDYLYKIGLPREISLEYAATIQAEDPENQAELDEIISLMKQNKIVLTDTDLERINIPLKKVGLVSSLNYLRANVHALKLYDAYNKFNYQVLNKMREKNNVIY